MPSAITAPALFPALTPRALLAFQFSAWYPAYAAHTMRSTVVRPLGGAFRRWMEADGVFLPEGSEDAPVESTLSDDGDAQEDGGDDEEEEEEEKREAFAFPELDAQIRDAVRTYGAVFPKLNFSSPRDAAWMLPASSPLKCVSPADVYLLLKSSDFVLHDVDAAALFAACDGDSSADADTVLANADTVPKEYELELVLRKWYPVDRSREVRCFVRREVLIAISQRDPNYYDFWNEAGTQSKVRDAVVRFWEAHIKGRWEASDGNYTFDFLLTRDLARGHIIDFNPYWPHTDPLLYTYEELCALARAPANPETHPQLRVIDSRGHPAAARNAPTHQHNMVPIEALAMSEGRSVQEFASAWAEEVRRSATARERDDESDASN